MVIAPTTIVFNVVIHPRATPRTHIIPVVTVTFTTTHAIVMAQITNIVFIVVIRPLTMQHNTLIHTHKGTHV